MGGNNFARWYQMYFMRFVWNITPSHFWHNDPNPYLVADFPDARNDLLPSYVALYGAALVIWAKPIGTALSMLVPFLLFLLFMPLLP